MKKIKRVRCAMWFTVHPVLCSVWMLYRLQFLCVLWGEGSWTYEVALSDWRI